mmetsp:Transcript_10138/g.20757  ORF Transcript_10138/g.20757 Transcript_10138/m.20757 type:complete len:243 (+) Transcript_10138:1100-1828(+)
MSTTVAGHAKPGGMRTELMAWTTPLEPRMSSMVLLSSTAAAPVPVGVSMRPAAVKVNSLSANHIDIGVIVCPSVRVDDITVPETTWNLRSSASSGGLFVRHVTVSAGSFANAALVGANTVNAVATASVSSVVTRSAVVTSETRVENPPLVAMSTMSRCVAGGSRTWSTMCTTPLLAVTSVAVAVAAPDPGALEVNWGAVLLMVSIASMSISVASVAKSVAVAGRPEARTVVLAESTWCFSVS